MPTGLAAIDDSRPRALVAAGAAWIVIALAGLLVASHVAFTVLLVLAGAVQLMPAVRIFRQM